MPRNYSIAYIYISIHFWKAFPIKSYKYLLYAEDYGLNILIIVIDKYLLHST